MKSPKRDEGAQLRFVTGSMNRREAFQTLAAGGAAGLATAGLMMALPAVAAQDPLFAFVQRWEDAERSCAAIQDDATFDREWSKRTRAFSEAAVSDGLPIATTPAGAAAALRKALRDDDLPPVERGLVTAALRFLEAAS